MRTLLCIFLCCLFTNAVSGQSNEGQQKNIATKNYLGYYHSVALAEEAVVAGHYQDAIKRYRALFEEYPYNNPIDCYVAAQVSSYIGDSASCLSFICKGICFGLPIQTINNNPHLAGYLERIENHFIDSCLDVYRKSIDVKARATMLSLIKKDQSIIRSLPHGEHIYGPDGYTLKDKYRPLWDSLLKEVVILIQASGFPAQKIIGTQNGEDSLFRTGPNSVFATYIFIHHGNAWNQAGPILWTELLKGNITPQMYGVIYESSNGKHSYNNPVHYFASRPCQERQCKKMIQNNLKEINNARWEIGLGSYEVMQKKFESLLSYYKWCQKSSRRNAPFFDFQCDLAFQGR